MNVTSRVARLALMGGLPVAFAVGMLWPAVARAQTGSAAPAAKKAPAKSLKEKKAEKKLKKEEKKRQ